MSQFEILDLLKEPSYERLTKTMELSSKIFEGDISEYDLMTLQESLGKYCNLIPTLISHLLTKRAELNEMKVSFLKTGGITQVERLLKEVEGVARVQGALAALILSVAEIKLQVTDQPFELPGMESDPSLNRVKKS